MASGSHIHNVSQLASIKWLKCVCMCLWACVCDRCYVFLWETGTPWRKLKAIVWLVVSERLCRGENSHMKILTFHHSWGGGTFKQLQANCRNKNPNILAKIYCCAIRKQNSNPQNSCRGYETLNKGQCSSWKSIYFTSSVDSIRTTLWQVYFYIHLMVWVGGKCFSIKNLWGFFSNCEHNIHTVLILQ